MALIARLPLKLIGSHVGVSLASDGPSQMALPDLAFFRAFTELRPNDQPMFHVLTPSDAVSAYALTIAMAGHEGSFYLRCFRPGVPFLYEPGEFPIGGHRVLAEGSDLLIASCGYMVHEVLKAREELVTLGIRPAVADFYSLPFDRESAGELVRSCGGRVLVVEDDYGGPLGAAFAEAATAEFGHVLVDRMFVREVPKSGRTPEAVLRYLGLSAKDIVERATRVASGVPSA
jgi:transketolase